MRRLFLLLIFSTVLFITLPLTVMAQNFRSGENVVLQKNEVINKDYFAAGNSVTLEGTVNGDAYLAGGNIIVDGTINGDLLAAGGNIDIRGTVTGNIRSAGGNINVTGTIGRNASLAGGNINFTAETRGSLTLGAGQATVGNKIGGDVNAAVGQLNLASNAAVAGDLTYLSRNSLKAAPEATVAGKTTQNIPPERKPREQAKWGLGFSLGFFILADFIFAAITGSLLIKFFPIYFDRISETVTKRPWASLGTGFLTLIIFPFAFILLLITIIGIPIAFIAAFVLGIALYFSKIFVSFAIGRYILGVFKREAGKIWIFLLGLLIYSFLTSIPILGWILSAVACLIGLGAILIKKRDYYVELRTKKII